MRPGVVIVNTARGGLIDEAALIAKVAQGHVGGAGLDVTEREPLPADDPTLQADGIVLTAHSAMASATARAELARRTVDAVIDLLHGTEPASIVNREVLASARLRIPELSLR
jgi:phosphoglycerate dehydrogenase-like enzyme